MFKKVVQFKKVNQTEGDNKKMGDIAIKASVINSKNLMKSCYNDMLLSNLRETGRKLSATLNIGSKDINKAIKEVRKDWK